MKAKFYWKSTCTSCRDARAELVRLGAVELDETNYTKTGLTADAVTAIVTAAGGVGAVINARHEIAKAKGWTKDAPPDVPTYAAAVAKEPNLIRRPILIAGKQVLVGFDAGGVTAAAYAKL